jgi:legumain
MKKVCLVLSACFVTAAAMEYNHTNCEYGVGKCNIGDHHGRSQTWPGERCQDPEAKEQDPKRCWQSTLEKAEAICNRHTKCIGVTLDNGGYEPRGGVVYYFPAALQMWLKQPPPKYTHTDCEGQWDAKCNIGDHHGRNQTWPGEKCQDPEAKAQDPTRCWQSNLKKAEAICNRHTECIGVTLDNNGYEPRGGVVYYHPAAMQMWLKESPSPPSPPTPPPSPPSPPSPGKQNWAVIVAGSSGYFNYRHQADACHAYQIMKAKGVPEENIILMAVDDIANDGMNPFRGKLFNRPTDDGVPGKDVYEGCKFDYKGGDVTPENFANVLTGTGNGKVLRSDSDDNVFVNFIDHGGVGLIGFPRSVMHKAELLKALETMKAKAMFKRLVFYLEACESGSMFEGMNIPGVYGLTAANAHESSWGTYCMPEDKVNGKHLNTCLGDLFSVKWMEDLDMETGTSETLEKQYSLVRSETTKSHVMQYGDESFTQERVSDFVGHGASPASGFASAASEPDSVASAVRVRELHLHNLYHAYRLSSTSAERIAAGAALQAQIAEQQAVESTFRHLAELSYPGDDEKQKAVRRRQEKPENPDCEKPAHMALRRSCGAKFNAGSGFAMQFQQVIVNICADVRKGLNLDVPAIAEMACSDAVTLVI